ncbi:GNAT family N-acetyltransferase [Rubrivirga sp. IMCC45206]|uniref:GNAT family N-acetyltransferase n=1 Tax=Rubrivirga sp. IMCC45206 TaxID=3391614 RepID=UPI0039901A1A
MDEATPTLTSPRLALRPVDGSDAAALHQHWTDPGVRRYLWDDEVISREQVEDLVAQSAQLFAERGYGLWAICHRDADDLLGCGGYWEFHEPPQLELVLSLSPAHWGRGVATEACDRLIRYAFDELGFGEVRASTDAPNEPSRRLIERLGFRDSHRADVGGLDTQFFTVSRSAYGSDDRAE